MHMRIQHNWGRVVFLDGELGDGRMGDTELEQGPSPKVLLTLGPCHSLWGAVPGAAGCRAATLDPPTRCQEAPPVVTATDVPRHGPVWPRGRATSPGIGGGKPLGYIRPHFPNQRDSI